MEAEPKTTLSSQYSSLLKSRTSWSLLSKGLFLHFLEAPSFSNLNLFLNYNLHCGRDQFLPVFWRLNTCRRIHFSPVTVKAQILRNEQTLRLDEICKDLNIKHKTKSKFIYLLLFNMTPDKTSRQFQST